MMKIVLTGGGILAFLGLVLFGGLAASFPDTSSAASPSAAARLQIPAGWLTTYQQAAATCPGLPWQVLAAIGSIESGHGANDGPSSAGALGPMQFMPDTWVQYGFDANNDGSAGVNDPPDAIYSAAKMLCANGGGDPAGLRGALLAYNHSVAYVDDVLATADVYTSTGPPVPTPGDVAAVLANPRITLTQPARDDLQAGVVDPQLVAILGAIAQRWTVGVSVIKTGHAMLVEGTDHVSLHALGRAMDLSSIDGQPVTSSNSAAHDVVVWLAGVRQTLDLEVGSPFPDVAASGFFSNDGHQDHIHVGLP